MSLESTRISERERLAVTVTEPRQTPPPPGRRFAEALGAGVTALVREAGATASLLPGGEILAAAVREPAAEGGTATGTPAGAVAEGPGTGGISGTAGEGASGDPINDMWRMQQQSQEFNVAYLQLQEGLSQENRRFSALSNVLKARHDTAKTVIQNIR